MTSSLRIEERSPQERSLGYADGATIVSTRSPHNRRIDALRYYAAALVITHHVMFQLDSVISRDSHDFVGMWVAHGETGVALFLVLSGFLFGRIAFADPTREIIYSRFLKNRILRIVPLLLLLLLAGASLYREKIDSGFWVSALTLSFENENIRSLDLLGPLWTIGVEFKFYLLFPLLVRAFDVRLPMWLGAIAVLVGLRAITLYAYDPSWWTAYNFTFLGRFDQILVGVLLARVFDRAKSFGGRFLPPLALLVGVGVLTTAFIVVNPWAQPNNHLRMTFYSPLEALGWALVVYAVVTFPLSVPPVEKIFGKMGEWSYSMYLLHIPIVRIVRQLVTFHFVADKTLNVIATSRSGRHPAHDALLGVDLYRDRVAFPADAGGVSTAEKQDRTRGDPTRPGGVGVARRAVLARRSRAGSGRAVIGGCTDPHRGAVERVADQVDRSLPGHEERAPFPASSNWTTSIEICVCTGRPRRS